MFPPFSVSYVKVFGKGVNLRDTELGLEIAV
jgi:hypothetical protein